MKKKGTNNKDPYESINKRLNSLIRLVAESIYDKKGKNIQETDVIRMLSATGLTPTEIAKIMGREGRGSVSWLLYGKSKSEMAKRRKQGAQIDKNNQ